jgi:hypothetical protein
MFKPFSLLFFVAVITWVVRIFITTDGSERIVRTCQPIDLFGGVAVSATALIADQFTQNVEDVKNKWVYGCRYIVWRSVYEKEYLDYLQQTQGGNATADLQKQLGETPSKQVVTDGTNGAGLPDNPRQKHPKNKKNYSN